MPLINGSEVVRIDLPATGEWVEVKAKWSQGDQMAVNSQMLKGSRLSADSNVDLDMAQAYESAEVAAIERAIVAWSFGEPVTPENIRLLDLDSWDCIKDRLNELYARRSDEKKETSASNGQTSPKVKEAPQVS